MFWPRGEPTVSVVGATTCWAAAEKVPRAARRSVLGVVLFIALPQEVRVRIRSVNAHVAERAFLKLGVQEVMAACLKVDAGIARARAALVVALQTDGKYHRPREHLRVHRSMRAMAGLAAFDSYRGVLV